MRKLKEATAGSCAAVEPTIPQGWRETASGWSWVSPDESVVVGIVVGEDGKVSAPHVVGTGSFWLTLQALRQAVSAQAALVDYLQARAAWEAGK